MSLPADVVTIASEVHLFHAFYTGEFLQVYASPLVADTDPLWLVVSARLAARPYVELPPEWHRDDAMMHGQAVLRTYAFP